MSIYLWISKISKVYIWGNEASAVYQWTTKIRPDIVPVTWVSLNTSSISFTAKNQTNQLTATVIPSTATNKNVTWASSNTSVATVSSNWLVTCKWNWNCTITVTTQDWWYTATCWVTAVVPRTFTISWTEKSDMSSWWTYSDDATWLTAGSTAFDEFFGYSAVRLNASWTETAAVTQTQSWWPWKLDITQLWTLTSWDNVMIKFPVRWIKMTKNWNTVTLSITDEQSKSGYQYFAFQNTWDVDTNTETTAKKPLYIWAYLGYLNYWDTALKSRSNQYVTTRYTAAYWLSYAKNNWTWWSLMWYYQWCLVNAYYMMKYWNPDSKTVVWRWYVWDSYSGTPTWWTNSQTNATYWTTWTTTQVKLFWLEDRWGNACQILWGCYNSSRSLYTALHDFDNTGSQFKFVSSLYSNGCTSSIIWNNKWMFAPISWVNNSNYNTYYSNMCSASNNWYRCYVWWAYNYNKMAWNMSLAWSLSTNDSYSTVGWRIMYL